MSEAPSWPRRRATTRFVIRALGAGDGARLREAVVGSVPHLAPVIPWARSDLTVAEAEHWARVAWLRYRQGVDFALGIFSVGGRRLLGGASFHCVARSPEDGELVAEIGLWISAGDAGAGLGTEVLRALVCWGLTDWPWTRLLWRCAASNSASRRCAEKAGLRLVVGDGEAATGADGAAGVGEHLLCFEARRGE
ncbi:MAG: GNAT family N-acetyltransferase [Candidatus Schekmanbacteria bacterium]|nr:GNAT family N-acetyltransferase [Candidatus Schekmanbacteria bacterium]